LEIQVHFPGGKRVQAEFKGHTVLTDQPVPAGGEDAAPSPYDLFLASLATCAGFFALNFCQSRGLPTDGLAVRQVDTWDGENRRLARVDLEVVAPHGFPEKYLEALRRAVEGCKVKRVVSDPPEFGVTAKLR
jgi:putative redox protein